MHALHGIITKSWSFFVLFLFVVVFFFFISALNIVYQRNGDGEAKSPACRAGVCEAVLHTLKQSTRFSAQVIAKCLHDSLFDGKFVHG